MEDETQDLGVGVIDAIDLATQDTEASAAIAAVEEILTPVPESDVIPGSTLDKLRAKRAAAKGLSKPAAAEPVAFTKPALKPGKPGKGPNVTVKRAGANLEKDATEYTETPAETPAIEPVDISSGKLTLAQLNSLPVAKSSAKRQRTEKRETRIAKESKPRTYVSDSYRPLIERYEADGTLIITEPERRDFGLLTAMNGDQLRLALPAVRKWVQLLGDCAGSRRNALNSSAQASALDYQARAKTILQYIEDRIAELGNGRKEVAAS